MFLRFTSAPFGRQKIHINVYVCVCLCVCVCVKVLKVLIAQSYPSLCNPMDSSPPGSSVHEFSRQENCSGLPFPSPGDFPNPGIEPGSPALQADSLPTKLWGMTYWCNGSYLLAQHPAQNKMPNWSPCPRVFEGQDWFSGSQSQLPVPFALRSEYFKDAYCACDVFKQYSMFKILSHRLS